MKAETKGTLLLFLTDALTLFLLLCGGLASVLPVSRFQVEPGLLVLWCVLFSAASAALYTWRWGGWTALGLLAAEALLVWRLWETLDFAFWLKGGYLNGAAEFLLLAFAAALVMGWVVVRTRCWYLAALFVLTPLLPAIIDGVLPNWTALTAAAAGWGTMLLSALYSRQDKIRLARGTLLSLGGMTLLLLTLNLALPMEGYDRPQWATNARDGLITAVSSGLSGDWNVNWEMSEFFEDYLGPAASGSTGGSGGTGTVSSFAVGEDGTVDLFSAGPRRYSGQVVMEISGAPADSGAGYLRGGTAAVYTGENWEAPAKTFKSGLDLPDEYLVLSSSGEREGTMTIRSLYSGTMAYVPYGVMGVSKDVTLYADGSARKRRALREYTVDYASVGSYAVLEGEAVELEELYREYVYENYLDVPEAAREALEPLARELIKIYYAAEERSDPEQWLDAMNFSRQAASILQRAAVYDLNTPAMEPGEDFVAHFLEEGQGYCVHFATAGVLLLRMKGIPARYVSGYVYEVDENGNGLVKDSGAHAWVEVYLDGRGWELTYEMTPANVLEGLEESNTLLTEAPEDEPEVPEEQEEPEETDVPDETADPDVPEEPEEMEESDVPEESETPGQSETEEPALIPAEPIDLSWLKPIAAAALVLGAFFALYRFGTGLRRRERELPDTNRSVIRAYLRCRRLVRWGAGEVPELEALAQKAKFSQHTLEAQERETAWALLDEAGGRLEEQLPRWKGRIFRWVKPVWF